MTWTNAAAGCPVSPTYRNDDAASSFEGFFASFEEPDLARTLFATFEDTRVDAWIASRYKGIRSDLGRLMRHARTQRQSRCTACRCGRRYWRASCN